MGPNSGITVGDLIEQLKVFNKNDELYMGSLTYYRLKKRGDNVVQLEFNETVYMDSQGVIHVDQVE